MRRLIAYFLLAVMVVAVLVLVGLATPIGRGVVANVIERAASSDSLTVSIDRLTGWPPFRLGADTVVLADAHGTFAQIDDLEVDVSVGRLLTGTLGADAITARRAVVARAPALARDRAGGALLPFVAERFQIAELVLGEALAGRPAALAVEGAASNRADGGFRVEVEAQRIDGIEGRLTARISRTDAAAPFAAAVDISEAADGILVGLMGRDSGPAYRLAASAAPQGDAVRGSVTLASDEEAQFSGGFALTPDGAGKRLQVTGSGDLAELVPPGLAGVLSGTIDIGLDADWTSVSGDYLPEIVIRRGQFSTATVEAAISGSLSREVADLSVRLDVADAAGGEIALPIPAIPSEVQRLSLRGSVAPSDGIVRADLVGNIAGLTVGDANIPAIGVSLAIENPPGGSIFSEELPFALRLEADAIRTPSGAVEASPAAPLLLVAEGTINARTAAADVRVDLAAADGRIRFDGNLSPRDAAGTVNAVFADVGKLAGLAGREFSGGVDATARGTFFGPDGADLQIDAALSDVDPGGDLVERLLRGRSNLTAGLAVTRDGAVAITGLEFSGESAAATASATIRGETIAASVSGAISDLSSLADRTAGAATFAAEISGARSAPEVDAAIRVDEGQLLGYPIREGIARLFGRGSPDGWTATATLGGSFAGKPLAGRVDVVASEVEGRFSFPDIDVRIDENRIVGALERSGDGLLSGTVEVAAPDLATIAALTLTEVAGTGKARLTFTPDDDRQAIAVVFSGDDVSFRAIGAQGLAGEVRIDDAFGTPQIDGNARATAARIGSARVDSIAVNASAEGDATAFTVSAQGADVDLSGAGALTSDAGVNVLRFDTITGSAYRVPVALQAPATIRLGDDAAGMPTMRVAVGGGSVVVEGAVSPELDLTIVADRVPASVANGFAPELGAEGTVSGRATVTGRPAAPRIGWQIDWSGMQAAATRKLRLPPMQVAASGDATTRETTLDASLTGAGLSLTITGSTPFAGEGLALAVRGAMPLSLLALESDREVRLAGDAQLDLDVSGSLRARTITGTASLADATIIDGETGFGVTGASGRIAFDGQRAVTEQISGRMAQGGQMTVAGSVDITSAELAAALTINIAGGRYNDGQVVNATFDAALALNGPLAGGGTLSGTVALGRTEIRLPDRLTVGAPTIAVTHVNAPAGFAPPLAEELQVAARRSARGNLRLEVDLTNSGGIFVRGFGVDAEFGGSLRVTNTVTDPQAVGAFTMRRGRIEVVGRRFELVSGTLTFAGDLVPVVDFTASVSTSDAVVTVIVIGPANDPTINFSSNPDLPEEEILSQLLFNRGVASLSVLQVAQLMDAAAQFSGVSGGQSFFARIRDAIGVDDLDIRQNASGGTTVGIGKRINENVSLGVEAGSGSDEGRVTIDLDITPNLKARGEAGQGGTGSVGLTYEREY